MVLPHGRGSAGGGYWRKSNGPWPQQGPGGRYLSMPLSSTLPLGGSLPGRGRELGNASVFAQVTGSGLRHVKIVRVFELVLLNSAPSRI